MNKEKLVKLLQDYNITEDDISCLHRYKDGKQLIKIELYAETPKSIKIDIVDKLIKKLNLIGRNEFNKRVRKNKFVNSFSKIQKQLFTIRTSGEYHSSTNFVDIYVNKVKVISDFVVEVDFDIWRYTKSSFGKDAYKKYNLKIKHNLKMLVEVVYDESVFLSRDYSLIHPNCRKYVSAGCDTKASVKYEGETIKDHYMGSRDYYSKNSIEYLVMNFLRCNIETAEYNFRVYEDENE